MRIFSDPAKLQKWALAARRRGRKIALVPTMGYLHEVTRSSRMENHELWKLR